MPKRISVAAHLSLEELEKRYRQAKDGIESRQHQIIWLLAQGKKPEEVEEITGYSRTWIKIQQIRDRRIRRCLRRASPTQTVKPRYTAAS